MDDLVGLVLWPAIEGYFFNVNIYLSPTTDWRNGTICSTNITMPALTPAFVKPTYVMCDNTMTNTR